jgi:CHAT domain-containing protein
VWWCPTGLFWGLPLHAADDETFIPSYTLTLEALLASHPSEDVPEGGVTQTDPVGNTNGVDQGSNMKLGIVGVDETGPNSKGKLQSVCEEVRTIESIVKPPFTTQKLTGLNANAQAVESLLRDCSWVHLACHGKQNQGDPRKSCLELYQSDLDLETILRLQLPAAEFVFLAACQTAKGDDKLLNESLHISGGFIGAGFQAAVGTLWTMNDSDGPTLAEMVYKHLFRNMGRPKVTETAKALQLAVKELRSKVTHRRWLPFIHIGV